VKEFTDSAELAPAGVTPPPCCNGLSLLAVVAIAIGLERVQLRPQACGLLFGAARVMRAAGPQSAP
jgi:hypothetical protein